MKNYNFYIITINGTFHGCLERLRACLWHGVPAVPVPQHWLSNLITRDSLLWTSEMYVVNGEEVHIFHMPCEGGTPHAKVQIWCVDTRNLGVISEKARKDRREIRHVPMLGIFRE